jgi:hypothetical protein
MATRNSTNPGVSTSLNDELVFAPSWLASLISDSAKRRTELFEGRTFDNTAPDGDFTRLDLFNTVGITEGELRNFMAKRLLVKDIGNNLEQKLGDLQSIYDTSISFMERVLYLKIPLGLRTKKWNSVDEFIRAIKDHTDNNVAGSGKRNGAYSIMFCALLKTMIVESDIYRNPKIDQLDQDLENLNNHLKTSLGLKEIKQKGKKKSEKLEDTARYTEYTLDGHTIRIASRAKTRDAIRLKEIFKRKYQSIEDFGDLLGVEIELDDTQSIEAHTHIISRIKEALYGRSKTQKIDGSLEKIPVVLEVKWSLLSLSAIEELQADGEIEVKKKKHSAVSSLDFEDAKFAPAPASIKGANGKRYTLNPEVRFVKSNNRNENGFASHDVMDLKRVLTAIVRLFGAITLGNLRYILEKFPYENHDDGSPKSPPDIMRSRHAILNHLLYPEKYSNGKSAKYPFLRILSTSSKQNGERKIYLTTNNAFFSEDGEYSLANIYSQYPPPIPINNVYLPQILEKVHTSVNGVLVSKTSLKSIW